MGFTLFGKISFEMRTIDHRVIFFDFSLAFVVYILLNQSIESIRFLNLQPKCYGR